MLNKVYTYLLLFILLIGCSSSTPVVEYEPSISKNATERMVFPNTMLYTLQGYNHVVNDHQTSLYVKDKSSAVLKVREDLIILNERGIERGRLQLFYDSFREIKAISGALYDFQGKLIRELDEDDIIDFPASSSYSLYEDNRVKEATLNYNQFPYGIRFEYEIELNGLLSVPGWYPQQFNEYVHQAGLHIETPDSVSIKIKEQNMPVNAQKNTSSNQRNIYSWELNKLEPVQHERFTNLREYNIPHVLLAAEEFEIDSYKGSFSSWKDFGLWYRKLNSGRQQLNEETRSEIDSLMQGLSGIENRARVIYKYLQENTRYISIQLGIGGWQTFPASFVEEKGYGDCKALTNFTFSIFEYAGIKAYPVLIKNGTSNAPIVDDFPSQQFNHVVLAVPDGERYIWLECTSQILPFGYISLSNADRYGLMITEEGGKLIHTPVFDQKVNYRSNNTKINVDENGDASIRTSTLSNGLFYEELLYAFDGKPESDHKSWLRNNYPINISDLLDFDASSYKKKEFPGTHSYAITTRSLVSKAGNRLFLPLNKLNTWDIEIGQNGDRTQDIDLRYTFTEIDSIQIQIPQGYYVESIPASEIIEKGFGTFSLKIRPETEFNTIHITRQLTLFRKKLSAEEFDALSSFIRDVKKADELEIVINKES